MTVTTVIFDLFGTLVDAPTTADRSTAAAVLAAALGSSTRLVERYLDDTWALRHDGSLSSLRDLAVHMRATVGSDADISSIIETWRALARPRLVPDQSVVSTLQRLRRAGVKVGLISDASTEIADAWPTSPIAPLVTHAVFSCDASAIKPAPTLYKQALRKLGAVPNETVYIGDGGGDELRGAETLGIRPIGVRRRGGPHTLVFATRSEWPGPCIDSVEDINPTELETLGLDRNRE